MKAQKMQILSGLNVFESYQGRYTARSRRQFAHQWDWHYEPFRLQLI